MKSATAIAPHAAETTRTGTALFQRLLDWLVARDSAWRDAKRLSELPPEQLADMGIPLDAARSQGADFYRARGRGPADTAPIPLAGGLW